MTAGVSDRQGPLTDSYPASVALVVFSLVPYLALSAAVLPLSKTIAKSLGMTTSSMDLTVAMSTAAYSAGTVLAVQFAMHLPARRMLVIYEAAFVGASVVAATAPNGDTFMGAFIAQGLCTSLMLIAAVPPLVTAWPAEKMPVTAGIMNLCIFGAVAAGPSLGALQLSGGEWRPLFWAVAGVAALAFVFSLLTFEDQPGQDASAPWDYVALVLTVVGCGAAFFGAGQLQAKSVTDAEALVPLVAGFALLVGLVIGQHQVKRPLMPIKAVMTTVPVTGIAIALATSAAAFGIMELLLQILQKQSTPLRTAAYFAPEFGAAVLVAVLFGILFRTRFTPILALTGMLSVVAAAALLIAVGPRTGAVDGAVTGLLGLGVGASVSPALFLAGLSLESKMLQRVFALIELMRGVTAFLVAPILVFLAGVISSNEQAGLLDAVWICLAIAGAGFVGALTIYLSGRPWLEVPDIGRWQGAPDQPAWSSPRLLASWRRSDGQAVDRTPTMVEAGRSGHRDKSPTASR